MTWSSSPGLHIVYRWAAVRALSLYFTKVAPLSMMLSSSGPKVSTGITCLSFGGSARTRRPNMGFFLQYSRSLAHSKNFLMEDTLFLRVSAVSPRLCQSFISASMCRTVTLSISMSPITSTIWFRAV